MIIGYEAKRIFHNKSGLGNYSRNLIRLLAQNLPQNKYLLYNSHPGAINFGEYLSNVKEIRPFITNVLYRNLWRQGLVTQRLKKDKIDVFHGLSMELPRGLEKTGIPSIVTVHDLIFLRYPELYKNIDRKIYIKKLKHALKSSRLISATSQQTKRDLIEYMDVEPARIIVHYQGVHPIFWHRFNPLELAEVQERFDLPKRFALYVGNLEPRKGALKILEAQVKNQIPVVYIGRKTNYWRKITTLKKFHEIAHLVFQPEVPRDEDLAKIYQLAEFFIYPSLFEGFGIPVLEALVSKTPVITSNRSSLPEVAGPASILIDPENSEVINEAMVHLWSHPEKQQEMIRESVDFIEKFRDENLAKQWQQTYQALLE